MKLVVRLFIVISAFATQQVYATCQAPCTPQEYMQRSASQTIDGSTYSTSSVSPWADWSSSVSSTHNDLHIWKEGKKVAAGGAVDNYRAGAGISEGTHGRSSNVYIEGDGEGYLNFKTTGPGKNVQGHGNSKATERLFSQANGDETLAYADFESSENIEASVHKGARKPIAVKIGQHYKGAAGGIAYAHDDTGAGAKTSVAAGQVAHKDADVGAKLTKPGT